MQIHQLQLRNKLKEKKRIGRGGKRGTYSGRGLKGQKARAGSKIRPASRDLIMRLPKLRGFKNKPFKIKPVIINAGDLEKIAVLDTINKETLVKTGIIKKTGERVKVLGGGEVKNPLKISGLEVSKSARKKIEAAGGHVS